MEAIPESEFGDRAIADDNSIIRGVDRLATGFSPLHRLQRNHNLLTFFEVRSLWRANPLIPSAGLDDLLVGRFCRESSPALADADVVQDLKLYCHFLVSNFPRCSAADISICSQSNHNVSAYVRQEFF